MEFMIGAKKTTPSHGDVSEARCRIKFAMTGMKLALYSDIENLVLWARSQIIGFAVNKRHGVSDGQHHPSGVKSKPDPLGQDSLLSRVFLARHCWHSIDFLGDAEDRWWRLYGKRIGNSFFAYSNSTGRNLGLLGSTGCGRR